MKMRVLTQGLLGAWVAAAMLPCAASGAEVTLTTKNVRIEVGSKSPARPPARKPKYSGPKGRAVGYYTRSAHSGKKSVKKAPSKTTVIVVRPASKPAPKPAPKPSFRNPAYKKPVAKKTTAAKPGFKR